MAWRRGRRAAAGLVAVVLGALGAAGCGSGSRTATAAPKSSSSTETSTGPLPGTGKPQVVIGDKNFTEQFVLGQLYLQALAARGFPVVIDRNIGPTEVTISALETGRLSMYPEYIGTWNSAVAGYQRKFARPSDAYQAGQRYAIAHGLELLNPTPFSDTEAIGVTFSYSVQNRLRTIGDLSKVDSQLALGAPPQFQQTAADLPTLEQAYGFAPAAFKPLNVGDQYAALDKGVVQAAVVNTTDGELITGGYALLGDPKHVFGWGNVVPVVSDRVVDAEGPAFVETINKVSSLLTLQVIRQLNAAVDVSHLDPAKVAKQFLMQHGLVPQATG
jgi:osmoprotectant transport system substrate-binding protein